jgi:hypothetical protein
MTKERLEGYSVTIKVRTDKHTYQQSFMDIRDANYWLDELFKKTEGLPYDKTLRY